MSRANPEVQDYTKVTIETVHGLDDERGTWVSALAHLPPRPGEQPEQVRVSGFFSPSYMAWQVERLDRSYCYTLEERWNPIFRAVWEAAGRPFEDEGVIPEIWVMRAGDASYDACEMLSEKAERLRS